MRAFLNDGKGLGSEHSSITNEYKSLPAMFRYAIRPFVRSHGGYCKAEIYNNFDNRYGTPDKIRFYQLEADGYISASS